VRAALLLIVALVGCTAASADDPGYELRIAAPATIELGGVGAVSVTVAPSAGRTISAEAPLRLELIITDDGLGLPRRRLLRKDAADPAAEAPRFDVKVRARAAGEHALAIEARFWLCRRRTCRPVVARRMVTLTVPAPMIDAGIDAPTDAGVDAPLDAGRRRTR
jgi:hypothetical protein